MIENMLTGTNKTRPSYMYGTVSLLQYKQEQSHRVSCFQTLLWVLSVSKGKKDPFSLAYNIGSPTKKLFKGINNESLIFQEMVSMRK